MKTTTTHAPGFASTESIEITYEGRGYRITGSPSLERDQRPMVEVWVAETAWRHHVYGTPGSRVGHWRRLRYGLRRDQIANHARRVARLR